MRPITKAAVIEELNDRLSNGHPDVDEGTIKAYEAMPETMFEHAFDQAVTDAFWEVYDMVRTGMIDHLKGMETLLRAPVTFDPNRTPDDYLPSDKSFDKKA